MKTNSDLVNFAKSCLGRPYIFGTFGQKLTAALIDQKAKQYPRYINATRAKKAKAQFIGQRSTDCIGLVKFFLWSESPDADPVYNSAQDWSADDTFNRATEKGKIDSLPDLPGVLVRYRGHVGVYIGNGEVIEARGFDYGIVKTALNSRAWTHWYKHPCICYESNTGANTGDLGHNTNADDSNEKIIYTVQPNDTLTAIAKKFNTTVGAIVALNRVNNPDLIGIGQKLIIPSKNGQTQNSPIYGPNSGTSKFYVVATEKSGLNMRTNPNGAIIGSIPKGAKVEFVSRAASDWLRVSYNGKTGCCYEKFLKPL